MIKAYGSSIEECFGNAAYAMMDQILDASKIELRSEVALEVEGETLDELLYNFLSEVLFTFDANHMALREFDVILAVGRLTCKCRGERFDRERHDPKTDIKAVTYHMLKVDEKEPSVTVIFDV